jgi:hypothetical protein
MSPVTHTLLQLALSVVGGVAANRVGAALYHEESVKSLAPHLSLPRLVGFLAGFFVAFILWDRFVPLHCPVCGGKMKKIYGEGRHLVFRCTECGVSH